MAILKKDKFKKRVIDLNGPEGNAFYLIGLADKLCSQHPGVFGSTDLIMVVWTPGATTYELFGATLTLALI